MNNFIAVLLLNPLAQSFIKCFVPSTTACLGSWSVFPCSPPWFREGTACVISLLDCSLLHWTKMFFFGTSFLYFPVCAVGSWGANLINFQLQEKCSGGSSNYALQAHTQPSPPWLLLVTSHLLTSAWTLLLISLQLSLDLIHHHGYSGHWRSGSGQANAH